MLLAACADGRELPLSPGESRTDQAGQRPTPVNLTGTHGSHYADTSLIAAVAHPQSIPAITGVSSFGGHYQVAIGTTALGGFPVQGDRYLVVSSGDARSPQGSNAATGSCQSDATMGTLCDVGGVEFTIAVPSGAQTLEFHYRYFANDYNPYEDPFRVLLVAGGSTTLLAQSTLSSEFGSKSGTAFQLGPTIHHKVVNIAAYQGQTITVRFQASDRYDQILDGGALVDNVVVGPLNQPPTAVITAPSTVSLGVPASFSGASSSDPEGTTLQYAWDFNGDNTIDATTQQASYTYTQVGAYTVKLTVTDGGGLQHTATATVNVGNSPPVVVVSAPASALVGTAVTFDASGSSDPDGHAITYAWDFNGDDVVDQGGATVSHTYTTTGTKTYKLTATDAYGAQTTVTGTVQITNQPPVAVIVAPDSVVLGRSIQFKSTGSGDPDGQTVTYQWDFQSDQVVDSEAAEPPPHTYDSLGQKVVTLKVSDGYATTTATHTVTVYNTVPVINSTGGPYGGARGVPITFSATATDPDQGDVLTYSWSFGDGNTRLGQTVQHAYAANGKYTVTLNVTDGKAAAAPASTTALVGHEVPVHVQAGTSTAGGVVVTATRTTGSANNGEYYVQLADGGGNTTFYLSEGGWLIHARNLNDRGAALSNPNSTRSYFLPVAPLPEGQALNTSTSESRPWIGVLFDPAASMNSVPLTPEHYHRLTATPALTLAGASGTHAQRSLSFQIGGSTLQCQLTDENGNPVSLASSGPENAFVVLPFTAGGPLPPLAPDVPGAGLQRGILLGAATLTNSGGQAVCSLAGLPSTGDSSPTPVLETSDVTVQTESGTQTVQYVVPFEPTGGQVTVTAVAQPPRAFIDYVQDPWGDGGNGDIGLVSYGWLGNDQGRSTPHTLAVGAQVRGQTEYTLELKYKPSATAAEQTILAKAITDRDPKGTTRWVWRLSPDTRLDGLPPGFGVTVSGSAQGAGHRLEGTVIWKVTLPGVGESDVRFRLIGGTGAKLDFAPNSGYRQVQPGSHSWEVMGE